MAVYFAQAVDGGAIKIGHSVDVPSRIKQLEAHYGQPLALLATMPGGREEERTIHERFSSLRFGKTEQFRPNPELLDFINRPLFVSAVPVVEAMPVLGKSTALVMRGSDEWRAWLESAAAHCRISVSSFVDFATASYAKQQGFPEKPPRR